MSENPAWIDMCKRKPTEGKYVDMTVVSYSDGAFHYEHRYDFWHPGKLGGAGGGPILTHWREPDWPPAAEVRQHFAALCVPRGNP